MSPRRSWPCNTSALPLPGAPLLGGFAALTGQVRLESVVAAIRACTNARVARSRWCPSRAETG